MNYQSDPRRLDAGRVIPALKYADQPYIVVLNDGSWLCTVTTGEQEEGSPGQHIRALRSMDQSQSWGPSVAIEPPDGPEASWVVPLHVPQLGGP